MDETILIGIAGIGLRLKTQQPWVAEYLRKKYEAFRFSGVPEATITVLTDPIFKTASLEHLEAHEDGSELQVGSSVLQGSLNLRTKRGSLVMASQGIENSLANFLRYCFQWLFLDRNGFLLHSAGLLDDGSAYLFFGSSGSGKTTLARQFAGGRVLNDEFVGVTIDKATVTAWGTPFWGDMEEGENTGDGGEVKALFRLQHGGDCRLETLPPSKSLAELVHCIPTVTSKKYEAGRILDLALTVLDSIPCYSMDFSPGELYWRKIHESCEYLSHEER